LRGGRGEKSSPYLARREDGSKRISGKGDEPLIRNYKSAKRRGGVRKVTVQARMCARRKCSEIEEDHQRRLGRSCGEAGQKGTLFGEQKEPC